jgi:2-keto-4-pentenoate hydratase/2-oxohepta-3-ene-1,7-dioic acid hydratase in catechol pathway
MTTTVATVAGADGPQLLIRQDDRLYDPGPISGVPARSASLVLGDIGDLFRAGPLAIDALRSKAERLDGQEPIGTPEDELTFLPPVAHPGKIICVGLNYRLHAAESREAVPVRPVLFAKFPNTLVGHRAPIAHHQVTQELDYEGELAVIIGRRCSAVSIDEALSFVGAYTILNDVSARDLQTAEPQWIRGKSLDTFAPMGPYAVIPDAGFDPASFRIRTTVSGDLRQDSSCGDMVFSVAEIIAFISEAITLEPGDIVSTGTPPGAGLGFEPPRYLSPGDTVSIEIAGIGVLTNPVIAA